ncbi:MAG: T9SS type A sorting domain-containing protein [Flavobacteriales bacterium]|nr:T9SS type A sorting domain-containing protein [Flavobacteriales bacterium]
MMSPFRNLFCQQGISLASDGLSYTNGNAYAIRLSGNASAGVQENDHLIGITMYPNPSEGLFTINTTEAGRYLVDVMNILGEMVQSTSFNNSMNMDLTGLAKGVYTVRVSNEAGSTVQKVTIR